MMTDKEQIINNFAKDINVPSKEQIICHGVDVSKCDRLNLNSAYGWDDPDMCSIPCCKNAPNCLFKQLARKTQEYTELKEDYKELEQRHNEAFQDFERLKKECEELTELLKLRTNDRINKLERAIIRRNVKIDRYRKALEEIEEFCITYSDNHDAYVTVYKYILDIINKVKGEIKQQDKKQGRF